MYSCVLTYLAAQLVTALVEIYMVSFNGTYATVNHTFERNKHLCALNRIANNLQLKKKKNLLYSCMLTNVPFRGTKP